ncbi:MAG: hypothetical protein R3E10_19280 [Gemmatimonadota bacterium]
MLRSTPTRVAALVAAALACAPLAGAAQDSPYSIGFQSSWPSYGLSGRYDASDQIQLQAVVGALGEVTNFSGRVNYDFQDKEKYDVYGYGAVGMWRYAYSILGVSDAETTIGLGGGAGFEFDLQEAFSPDDDSFPPLFWSLEAGFVLASFDNYNWSPFVFGGGIHYHF